LQYGTGIAVVVLHMYKILVHHEFCVTCTNSVGAVMRDICHVTAAYPQKIDADNETSTVIQQAIPLHLPVRVHPKMSTQVKKSTKANVSTMAIRTLQFTAASVAGAGVACICIPPAVPCAPVLTGAAALTLAAAALMEKNQATFEDGTALDKE
jgi:hypothetical protein